MKFPTMCKIYLAVLSLLNLLTVAKSNCRLEICKHGHEFCDTTPLNDGRCQDCSLLKQVDLCSYDNKSEQCLIMECKDAEIIKLKEEFKQYMKSSSELNNSLNRTISDLKNKLTNLRMKVADQNQTISKKTQQLIANETEFGREIDERKKIIDKQKKIIDNQTDLIKRQDRQQIENQRYTSELEKNLEKPDGSSGFKAEAGRYHLYVALSCPWASRAVIVRALKGLEDVISLTVVDWLIGEKGWSFTDKKPKCTLDTVNGCNYLREVYNLADPGYTGRVTVPCLWDKQKKTVVNNESSEIIRMFNTEFNTLCKTDDQKQLDLYPGNLRAEIDELNSWIYPQINNGVHRSGFANSQEAYDVAVTDVFNGLDKVDYILSKRRYLTGPCLTEADVRLFTTLIRFDSVYHTHFKCNKKRMVDYKNLFGYICDIYQIPGIAQTVDMDHIVNHYYHTSTNSCHIVPIGPDNDYNSPHNRDKM